MDLDLRVIVENIRKLDTEELLDRVTVFRGGMEPAAIDLIYAELSNRGVHQDQIDLHEDQRKAEVIFEADGTAIVCSFCDRPATVQARGWHKLWGKVPLFPRLFSYCSEHAPLEPRTDP